MSGIRVARSRPSIVPNAIPAVTPGQRPWPSIGHPQAPSYSPWLRPCPDPAEWSKIAAELGDYRRLGLAALLTKDMVRFATARTLVDADVAASDLRAEQPHPTLPGASVDLTAGKRRSSRCSS